MLGHQHPSRFDPPSYIPHLQNRLEPRVALVSQHADWSCPELLAYFTQISASARKDTSRQQRTSLTGVIEKCLKWLSDSNQRGDKKLADKAAGDLVPPTRESEEFLSQLHRAAELAPNDGPLQLMLGLAMRMNERLSEAETALRVAAANLPQDGRTWKQLGQVLRWQHRIGEASATFAAGAKLGALPSLHQHVPREHFNPTLPTKPWYTVEDHVCLAELVEALNAKSGILRQEYASWQQAGAPGVRTQWERVHTGGSWRQLQLHPLERAISEVAQKYTPLSLALIEEVHARTVRVETAHFSILSPRVWIRPHSGSHNSRLTAHLTLVARNASIRVHRRTRAFRIGAVLLFDDSFEHEVWNRDADEESGMDRGHSVRSRGKSLPQGRRLYEFLLCKVGVGRSYLIEEAEAAQTLELPPEYDSFFVRHDVQDSQPMELDSEGVLPHHVMHHEYIIRDPSQALPMYLVHFEYDPEAPERLTLPICDNCGIKAALLYCEADVACLCESCDTRIHAVNPIAQKHIRVPINERPGASMGMCPDHPDEEADEYCVECEIPICVHCKSLGSHGSGTALKHKRMPIFDAYRSVLRQGRDGIEGATSQNRNEVESKLAELDAKLAMVQQSGMALEDRAYDAVQNAVAQGRDIAEEQASYYFSDELEVKRQMDQSAWLESFLEEKVKALPPADFMQTWNQHCLVREDLFQLGALQKPRPQIGLRVDGRLRVVAGLPRGPASSGYGAAGPGRGGAISLGRGRGGIGDRAIGREASALPALSGGGDMNAV